MKPTIFSSDKPWQAVIALRNSGARLFLTLDIATGKGFIYSSSSNKWSRGARPFDGPVLANLQVKDAADALDYFRAWRKLESHR